MTIMSLCFFFNAISQKVIDEESLDELEKRLFETIVLLEAFFPPSFFDVSVHLIVHLIKEIRSSVGVPTSYVSIREIHEHSEQVYKEPGSSRG